MALGAVRSGLYFGLLILLFTACHEEKVIAVDPVDVDTTSSIDVPRAELPEDTVLQDCSGPECGCVAGRTRCGSECVDVSTQLRHCGGCFNACRDSANRCVSGLCMCSAPSVVCGEDCVDVTSDPEHCGACGATCEDDEQCVQGQCACRFGLLGCGEECVDPQSNSDHCGVCDNACPSFCFQGSCTSMSCDQLVPAAESCGSSECVELDALDSNPLHCGGCDQACKRQEICVGDIDASGQGQADCLGYETASFCTSCPCSECEDEAACCLQPGTTDRVLCVEKSSDTQGVRCPQ